MTFTNLEKYLYSKKCLKQRRQLPILPPPPHPSLQQSRWYFRAEKVTWLRLLFWASLPADVLNECMTNEPQRTSAGRLQSLQNNRIIVTARA